MQKSWLSGDRCQTPGQQVTRQAPAVQAKGHEPRTEHDTTAHTVFRYELLA